MSVATDLVQNWETTTGRDARHSARLNRALQVANKSPVGTQGRAAQLNTTALLNFLFADMTGDSIATSPERATTWTSAIREDKPPLPSYRFTEADETFWEWANAAAGDAGQHRYRILPRAELGSGIEALLERMSDATHNVTLNGVDVPFNQIVSHLGLKIELLMGGPEGLHAIVHCGARNEIYSAQTQPSEKLRNARWPVRTRVTIEFGHLALLARLWADTKARTSSAQPVPPSPPSSPDGPGNGNAEAVPTASAPTPNTHPDKALGRKTARNCQNGSLNSSEGNARARESARVVERDSPTKPMHGVQLDAFLLSAPGAARAA